jgi:hypothetical protein
MRVRCRVMVMIITNSVECGQILGVFGFREEPIHCDKGHREPGQTENAGAKPKDEIIDRCS